MTKAGGFRYLRAAISTDLSSDQIIASLAHELQHVVEVIEDSNVVDERSLVALYKRIGEPAAAVASRGVGNRGGAGGRDPRAARAEGTPVDRSRCA